MDCGPTCLQMLAKYYGKTFAIAYLRQISNLGRDGSTLGGLADAAEKIGFSTLAVNVKFEELINDIPLPCIAHWRQRHYVVVYEASKKGITIADPGHGLITYSVDEFKSGWIPRKNVSSDDEGILLLFETTPAFYEQPDGQSSEKQSSLKFLSSYFQPFRKLAFQLFIGLIISTIIQLAFPFLTQQIVDVGINTKNINFIYLILGAQLMLFASQTGISVIRSWILLHITSRMNLRMLSDFLIKLMNLPISFFDSKSQGDLLQRIQDHNRVQLFLSATTLDVLFSIVPFLVFGFILAYFNVNLFIVFFSGSALYIFWVLIFMKRRGEIDYKYFDQASGNQSSTIQLISGMQEIKLNGSEKRRRWEWEAIQIRLFKLNIKSLSLSQTQSVGGQFINEIKNILISFLAAASVINGEITFGGMLAVQYIIGQLNVPINNFLLFLRSYQDARLSIARLSEIHGKPNEELNEKQVLHELPSHQSLLLDQVSFRYGSSSSSLILKNLTIEIPQKKVTAIVGASGSGKTTLLKLLLKFYEPAQGKIYLGNISLNDFGYNFWRSKCGVVMQDGFIFSDTIARNISESDTNGAIDTKKLNRAIHIANLNSFIDELPMGLNTRIGASGTGISGGQKQRILIARSVYKDPDFLFLDEATSALDANNEAVIMKNLGEFFTNRTVVIVAHRLSTVKNADKIIVLDKGEIVETGNHEELSAKRGFYYTLIKNQLELGE
jgi:ATP-binding cassette subfamily B protein